MSRSAGYLRGKVAGLELLVVGPTQVVRTLAARSGWIVALALLSGCVSGLAARPSSKAGQPAAANPVARPPFAPSRGRGALWMPMTWTLRLYRGERVSQGGSLGESLAHFHMRRVALLLRQVDSGAETQLRAVALAADANPPSEAASGSDSAELSLADTSRSFSFEKITELEPGRYALEAIRGEAADPSKKGKPVTITLPLPNPIDPTDEGPLIVEVQKDSVSAVGRLAFETAIGSKAGGFSTQTRGESLEAGRLAESSIARDLNWLGDGSAARQAPRLIKAHPMVADLRGQVSVSEARDSPGPRPGLVPVGFAVESPCDAKVQLKLLWKADADTKEYVAMIPLWPGDGPPQGEDGGQVQERKEGLECEAQQGVRNRFVILHLRPENWLLQATEVVSDKAPVLQSRISALQQPSTELRRYYAIEDAESLAVVSSVSEQQIRRRFYLPLRDLRGLDNQLYYGGQIAVTRPPVQGVESKTDLQKASPGSGTLWGVALKKSFNASQLRQVFGRQRLWNPFTGAAIEADNKLGRIESMLQVAADAKKTEELGPFVAGLRKGLTESFARCVQRHEEGDPLIVARTRVQFQIASRQRAVTLDSLVIDPAAGTDPLALCFRKEVDSFRFARPVPAGFRAEMELEIE